MKNEEGVTVVELLVTVILVLAVSFITFGFFDSVTSVSSRASRNVITESGAQIVLREMTQEIRGANPVSATYPTTGSCPPTVSFALPPPPPPSATATGYLNCLRFALVRSLNGSNFCINPEVGRVAAPYSMITYGLKAGVLYKDRTDYNASCGVVSTGAGRQILTGLANASTSPVTPLFTYFDGSGTQIADNQSVAAAGSVKISLIVPYQTNAPNLVLTSVASLRNN